MRPFSRRRFVATAASALGSGFVACRGLTATSGTSGGGGRLTSRPDAPSIAPEPGSSRLDLGGARDGLLYVPTTYDPGIPVPLLVALHGTGGQASSWGGWDELAEQRGFVFLAVDSRGDAWSPVEEGDLEFLDRALDHTFERIAVDRSRLALVGYSSGASYALSVGIPNGDLFSHLIGYALGFYAPLGPATGRPSVFLAYGTRDRAEIVSSSRGLAAGLEDSGYTVTLRSYDGGHAVPQAVAVEALDELLDR